jgi:hypothetical protein
VASISLADLPEPARGAWSALKARLRAILGDDVVAIWAHGGTTAVADEPHHGDLDTYVILASVPNADAVRAIGEAHDAIAQERAVEWDAWYVLEADARQPAAPRHAFRHGSRDTSWAIHRAHWLDGRHVVLHGAAPGEIVPAPTAAEIEGELSRELEHIERHVLEGDTDPFEATYALLNGSRILHAVETGNVAISKAAAGAWAQEHLPARWRSALDAARRSYTGAATQSDTALLAAEMAPFVEFVRQRLPLAEPRPAGELPRWSGS